MANHGKRLDVYNIREYEKDGKKDGFWLKVGVAFENKDGSFNLILQALPVDGKLHMREPSENTDFPSEENAHAGKRAPTNRRAAR